MADSSRRWHRLVLMLATLSVVTTLSVPAEPQSNSVYRPVKVGAHVRIDVPEHWHILNADLRRNVTAVGEAAVRAAGRSDEPIEVASLAVNAVPSPPGAIIRVTYMPTEGADRATQADLALALLSDRAGTIATLQEAFSAEHESLAKSLEHIGGKLLETEPIRIDEIGGKIAIQMAYRRTSLAGPSTFYVTQYHVPLRDVKVLITLSYRESQAVIYRTILDHVKTSIRID